jgi:transposase-like protein
MGGVEACVALNQLLAISLHRDGYCDRDWETRAGTVEPRIPKLRRGGTSRRFSSRAGWPRRRWLR